MKPTTFSSVTKDIWKKLQMWLMMKQPCRSVKFITEASHNMMQETKKKIILAIANQRCCFQYHLLYAFHVQVNKWAKIDRRISKNKVIRLFQVTT